MARIAPGKLAFLCPVLIALLVASLTGSFCSAAAQEVAVPPAVHVPLMFKLLTLDRHLSARVGEEIVLGVLYQSLFRTSVNTKDAFMKTLDELRAKNALGLKLRCVAIDLEVENLEDAIAQYGIEVLYVTPLRAVGLETVTEISRAAGVTTLTGVVEYVPQGVALGIGLKAQKPEILVNLIGAKAEGVDFSPRVLKLARVYE